MIRRLQSEKKICVCLFKSLRKLRIGDFGLWALDSCEVQLTNFAEGPESRGPINAIVGENRTFVGEEELLRSRGVSVEVLQNEECIRLMEEFIRGNPTLWNEDIGV